MSENLTRQIKQIKNMNQLPKEQNQLLQTTKKVGGQELEPISKGLLSRSSTQPAMKGKVCRGVNYDPGSLSIFTKAKLKDL